MNIMKNDDKMNDDDKMIDIIKSVLKNKDSVKSHKFADTFKEWMQYAESDNIPKELDEQFDKAWDEVTDEIMDEKEKE